MILLRPPPPPAPLQPILRYPLSYISYHSFAFTGFMRNEFQGTQGWQCPPASNGVPPTNCSVSGAGVLSYYEIMDINKWVCLAILAGMALFYRTLFFLTLKLKEARSR